MKKPLLFCTLSFVLCIGATFAYTSTDFSNANYLADQQIVVKQTVASKYRLDDKILRQEVIGMALKVKGITLPENYTCKKYFADATKNDWICRAVELAADNGIITRSNKYANPGKSITRAEALAMVMKASGEYEPTTQGPSFYDANSWQTITLLTAHDHFPAIFTETRSDINPDCEMNPCTRYYFYPNRLALRSEVFGFAKNILSQTNTSEITNKTNATYGISYNADIYSKLEQDAYGNMLLYFGDERNIGVNDTARAAMRIEDLNGTPVDFLTDVFRFNKITGTKTINGTHYLETKVYDMSETTIYWAFSDSYSFSFGDYLVSNTQQDAELLNLQVQNQYNFTNKDVLKMYYIFLGRDGITEKKYMTGLSNFLYTAYFMRSPSGVSEETFFSWYKNTESVTFREDTLKDLGDNTYEFLVDMTENGVRSTYKVKSKVSLEKFTIDNISSVKQ